MPEGFQWRGPKQVHAELDPGGCSLPCGGDGSEERETAFASRWYSPAVGSWLSLELCGAIADGYVCGARHSHF